MRCCLFLVVSFSANGKVRIFRSERMPSSLSRTPLEFAGLEGTWKIVDCSAHPECIGCEMEIYRQDPTTYSLHAHVVNVLNCTLKRNPATNEWKSSSFISTLMAGPPEQMNKEHLVCELISSIQSLEIQNDEQLLIETNDGGKVHLARFIKAAPSSVTNNIFN